MLCLPLPSFAHVLHAGLRCVGIRLEMTTMPFEAIDDSAPIFSTLLTNRYVLNASCQGKMLHRQHCGMGLV